MESEDDEKNKRGSKDKPDSASLKLFLNTWLVGFGRAPTSFNREEGMVRP